MADAEPCSVPGCVALASAGATCPIHRELARVTYTVTCVTCSKPIKSGTWYRSADVGPTHYPACKHPAVATS